MCDEQREWPRETQPEWPCGLERGSERESKREAQPSPLPTPLPSPLSGSFHSSFRHASAGPQRRCIAIAIAGAYAVTLLLGGCVGPDSERAVIELRTVETRSPIVGALIIAHSTSRYHPLSVAAQLGWLGPLESRATTDANGRAEVEWIRGRTLRVGVLASDSGASMAFANFDRSGVLTEDQPNSGTGSIDEPNAFNRWQTLTGATLPPPRNGLSESAPALGVEALEILVTPLSER